MDGNSLNLKQEKLNKLKELIPEAFTEDDKIDVEKLKLTLGEDIEIANERYVLNWAGKSEAFKVLQTPTTATLAPDKDESVNFDTTDNIFIEGENLEVLKVLQKSYYGKVQMIYIDPPYNTGNDSFIYPDKYEESKEDYLKRISDKDEDGYLLKEGLYRKNSKENGHFHSNWLSMMFSRLFLSRNLLDEDGVIFVSIDDNEVFNLRLLMNEIFGEENFIGQFVWKSRQNKDNRNVTGASLDHEYVLCYGRRIRGSERKLEQYSNPDNDERGDWVSGNMVGLLPEDKRPNCHFDLINPETGINYGKPKLGWRYDRNTMNRLIAEQRIIWPPSPDGRPRRKVFLNELKNSYTGYSSIIGKDVYTRNGTIEVESLFGFRAFDFPKPTQLIKELILQGSGLDDIILDFFGGSGSTAQAIYELNKEDGGNRRFIIIQLPERIDDRTESYQAGYKNIADICKARVLKVIQNIENEQKNKPELFDGKEIDLGIKIFRLKYSNFKLWRGDVIENDDDLKNQIDVFENPVREGSEEENILYELILKSGYELTTKIEKKDEIYLINDNDLVLALNKIDDNIIEKIIQLKPKKCLALDKLFEGNDQLKTNTVLQMKDAGIEFKTV